MKNKLLEKANRLVGKYNQLLLKTHKHSFGIGSIREVFSQNKLDKLKKDAEGLSKEYAAYIRMYNEFLNSQKGHTPEIHNMKHQFDIVSSMKAQATSMISDKEQRANLYIGAYFNTISIVVALVAITLAAVIW